MADPSALSPLAGRSPSSRADGAAGALPPGVGQGGVVMAERALVGKLVLRGDADDAGFRDAVRGALGFDLPLAANTASGAESTTALWLGPNEWLVATAPGAETAAAVSLKVALSGRHASVTDVSDSRTVIRLSGANARDVLAKGCPIDLHPRVFGPGRVAQSLVARAGVILHQVDESPTFDLYVVASFAGYLWDWLVDAAAEFGVAAGR
ncbi:MAG: sarcosine oxidase subunit gamma [Alphaproteobacteria bacterium]|nr:sarcosine oxidase subunit gamma [Alphaproteobacteria bacterium]